ncbi:hypothetical protein ACEQ8H_003936 [Pleosporales sp. CAS-2024a]
MSTTIISHQAARFPIVSTVAMIYGLYEARRIHTGQHHVWSPLLEAYGITSFSKKEQAAGSPAHVGVPGDFGLQWTNVNGIPVPTLAAVKGASREE